MYFDLQFMNKVLYAREGAKGIMDRTFKDFPWQIRVEVDGVEIEVPEVSTLILILKLLLAFLGNCWLNMQVVSGQLTKLAKTLTSNHSLHDSCFSILLG